MLVGVVLGAMPIPDLAALWRLFADREALSALVRGWGPWGPLLFMGVQIAQVVVWMIPGEVTGFVGGYLFGTGLGFVYSTIGLTIGTMATFALGRMLGPAFIRRVLGTAQYERVRAITTRAGAPVAFVLYLIPGFPKDVLGYFFGISNLPGLTFFVVTTLARLPGTWILSLQGDNAAQHAWLQFIAVTGIVAVIAAACYWARDRILARARQVRRSRV